MKVKGNILLVDDDETSNLINEIIIKKTELFDSITVKSDARSALNYLSDKEKENLPDVIFLDINMPGIDGWEFLEKYSELSPNSNNEISIYMLSSSQNPDDIVKAEKHPLVKEFLSKPLSIDFLKEKFHNPN